MSTLSIDTANFSLIGTQSYLIGTSASASSTITLYTDGACTVQFGSSTTTSSSSNKWYFSLSGITRGLYTVYAKETISNTSTISNGVSIYVYTGQTNSNSLYAYYAVPPPSSTYTSGITYSSSITTPTINETGLVKKSDRYIFSRTPSLSGSSDPYAMIELFYSGTVFGVTQATDFGTWTYFHNGSTWSTDLDNIPTQDYTFVARAYDEDYNYSSDAQIAVTIIDSSTITKPSTPVISSSFSSTVTDNNTVTITGTCAKGTYDLSKVTLSYTSVSNTSVSNTTYIIKTIESDAKSWFIKAYLPNGIRELTATVTDAVGNESNVSTPVTVKVDVPSATSAAEAEKTIDNADTASNVNTSITATNASYASQVNGMTVLSKNSSNDTSTSTASITYSGFTPNSTITVYMQSTTTYLGTYTTDGFGTVIVIIDYATVAELDAGVHSLSAYEEESKTVKIIPIVVVETLANAATGLNYVNQITSFTLKDEPTLSGLGYTVGKTYISNKKITSISGKTTTTRNTVSITKNGVINTVDSDVNGLWSYSISSDGIYTISAAGATDTDKIITLIIDTIPPVKPIIKTTANNTISGSAEANANVIIRENNKVLKTVTASAQGNWFYKPDYAMPARPHTFSIVAQDAANNNSDANAFTNEFAFSMSKSVVRLVPGQPVNVNAVTRKTISDPTLSFSISPEKLPEGLKFNKRNGKISGTFTGSAFPSQKYTITTRSSVFVRKTATVRMEMAPPN
jgi:hypothetical protein